MTPFYNLENGYFLLFMFFPQKCADNFLYRKSGKFISTKNCTNMALKSNKPNLAVFKDQCGFAIFKSRWRLPILLKKYLLRKFQNCNHHTFLCYFLRLFSLYFLIFSTFFLLFFKEFFTKNKGTLDWCVVAPFNLRNTSSNSMSMHTQ